MNIRALRCWFRGHHNFAYRLVTPDPKNPDGSVAFFEYFSQQFDGHPLALNICTRCGNADGTGPVIPDGKGGTIPSEQYLDERLRRQTEQIAQQIEDQHGDVKIDLPSIGAEQIPIRDAMRLVTEMNIAIENDKRKQE